MRLLTDRGGAGGREVEVPESVQALIAARLDTLTPGAEGLLQDAAVVGKVFWAGALAAMGERDLARGRAGVARAGAQGARPARPHLARWRARPSTASGTPWSGMSATARSPAPAAAERAPAAAGWIEQKAGERAEDLADVLAYHYLAALELSEPPAAARRRQLRAHAVRYLAPGRRTGARPRRGAGRTDIFARALELAADDDPVAGPAAWSAGRRPRCSKPAARSTRRARTSPQPPPPDRRPAWPPAGR